MAGSLNKVILIGNLTKNPEVRTTPSGAKVANFGIAMNESYKDKQGQKVEKVEFINIVLWRGLAEVAERYLKKGSMICIEGKLTTRSWDDASGQKKYMTEIVGDQMQMLGGRNQESSGGGYEAGPQEEQFQPSSTGGGPIPPAPEDDLPF